MVDILTSSNANERDTPERQIKEKYNQLLAELQQMRINTIGSTYVDPDGNVKVTQTPGLAALQSRIVEKEKDLADVLDRASQINKILDDWKVGSISGLQEKREELNNTIQTGPIRCWEEFRLTRGEGKYDNSNRTGWLASDIVKVESYKTFEDTERSIIEHAKTALEPVNEALHRLEVLTQQ